MANTKYILEQIKIESELKDLIAKSNGENVSVTYNEQPMTLAQALTKIYTDVSNATTGNDVDNKISAAINDLIDGAPETYNTLKEISDYISTHGSEAAALTAQVGNKVDKEDGKQLSTEDFTTLLKNKLETMPNITADDKTRWDNKAEKTAATESADGLMSADDKKKLNALRGVRYGDTAPEDMQEGELFVHVVPEE